MYTVYALLSKTGELLYVGRTKNWGRRLAEHAYQKAWFTEVAKVNTTEIADRATAERLEWKLIREQNPKYNDRLRDRCPKCGAEKDYKVGRAYCAKCFNEYQRERRRRAGARPRSLGPILKCPKCGGAKPPGPNYCKPCKNEYDREYRRTH